jgi:hypothetical protein
MVCFHTKKSQFGYVLDRLGTANVSIFNAHLVHSTAIWYVCVFYETFIIFYQHLVRFVVIWCISPFFGTMYREKSGNPVLKTRMYVFR